MTQQLPSDYLRTIHAPTADAFRELRTAVVGAGPLDFQTVELIMFGGFVTASFEPAIKAHAARIHGLGVSRDALRQAALVTFGATTTLVQVTRALRWIDEALDETAQAGR